MVESNLFLLAKSTLTPLWPGRLWGWGQKRKFIQDMNLLGFIYMQSHIGFRK